MTQRAVPGGPQIEHPRTEHPQTEHPLIGPEPPTFIEATVQRMNIGLDFASFGRWSQFSSEIADWFNSVVSASNRGYVNEEARQLIHDLAQRQFGGSLEKVFEEYADVPVSGSATQKLLGHDGLTRLLREANFEEGSGVEAMRILASGKFTAQGRSLSESAFVAKFTRPGQHR